MKTAAFTWWMARVCLLITLLVYSDYACTKKYIRFDATPVYDKDPSDPQANCTEHFDGGTRTVTPHYDGNDGTSPGEVKHSTRDGESGQWSTSTDKQWYANDVGSKVTWNNGAVRTGAGATTYTFVAPTTPISYSVVFKTHAAMLDGRTLVGEHLESVTKAGGEGISIQTWPLTTPQPNDPIGTQRAYYDGGTVKVHEKNIHFFWEAKYALPKPSTP